jgi:hypothetical protein
MATSNSNDAQIAIVAETVQGVTPANPVWLVVKATGESLKANPQTEDDTEFGKAGRSALPMDIGGLTVNGGINFNLRKSTWFDAVLSGVFASPWGICPADGSALVETNGLFVGKTLQTFSVEKRLADPVTPGSYLYQRFVGSSFSNLQINVTPKARITGSVSVVGGTPSLDTAAIAGATYTPAEANPVFRAPDVLTLTMSGVAVGTYCWTQATLTFDSGNTGLPCIGSSGDREVALGLMKASLAGSIYLRDQTIIQAMYDNTSLLDAIVDLQDTALTPNHYWFQLFDVKPTAAEAVISGPNTQITIPLTVEATPTLICPTASPTWESSVYAGKATLTPL